jgi:hypothetical protein
MPDSINFGAAFQPHLAVFWPMKVLLPATCDAFSQMTIEKAGVRDA